MTNSVVTLRKVLKFKENPISRSKYIFLVVFYFFGIQKIAICINLQLPIAIFKKSIFLDIIKRTCI